MEKYYLTFDIDNNYKYSESEIGYIEDLGKDKSDLVFEKVPTQKEVNDFLEKLSLEDEEILLEQNDDNHDENIENTFSNIKLLEIDEEDEVDTNSEPVKEYNDYVFTGNKLKAKDSNNMKKKKNFKDTFRGEDILNDLIERAQDYVDEGTDENDAIFKAFDEGLIYTRDVIDLAEHYGCINENELRDAIYDDVYSDISHALHKDEDDEDDDLPEDIDTEDSIGDAHREQADEDTAEYIYNYTWSSGDDEFPRRNAIINNLARKKVNGVYDEELAKKAFIYLAQDGAKKCGKRANPATIELVAEYLLGEYEVAIDEKAEELSQQPYYKKKNKGHDSKGVKDYEHTITPDYLEFDKDGIARWHGSTIEKHVEENGDITYDVYNKDNIYQYNSDDLEDAIRYINKWCCDSKPVKDSKTYKIRFKDGYTVEVISDEKLSKKEVIREARKVLKEIKRG